MKNKLLYCALGALLSLASCNDDNEHEFEESLISEGKGKMEVMSAEDQMKFIEETAGIVLSQLNPEDQKPLILNAAYAQAAYGSLEAPSGWRAIADQFVKNATSTIAPKDPVSLNNPDKTATRGSSTVIYNIFFSDFSGIYSPGDGEWVKTGDSSNIEFRFPGADGAEQSFVIVPSEETFLYSFMSEEWEGTNVVYTSTAVHIPTTLKATYYVHGQALADANITYDIVSRKNGSYDIKASIQATAANISANVNLMADDHHLGGEYEFYLNGKKAINGALVAEGKNLTNVQHIMLLTKLEDVIMQIDEIEAYTDILGRVQINSELDMTRKLFELKKPGDLSLNEADTEGKKLASILNGKSKTWLRFNGTKTEQSRINWGSNTYELNSGWIYLLYPEVHFSGENITLSPEELVSMETATAIQEIIEAYKQAFGK